jgi:hypothetical protein
VSDFGLGHLADDSAAFFGVGESVGQICSFDVVEQKVGLFGEIFRRSVAGRVLVAIGDAFPGLRIVSVLKIVFHILKIIKTKCFHKNMNCIKSFFKIKSHFKAESGFANCCILILKVNCHCIGVLKNISITVQAVFA